MKSERASGTPVDRQMGAQRRWGAISGLLLVGACVAIACGEPDQAAKTGRSMARKIEPKADVSIVATENRPPRITEVRFEPRYARPGERVSAKVEVSDPDGDAIELTFEWRAGGEVIGSDDPVLRVPNIDRGTEISVSVTATDSEGNETKQRLSARADNQAPTILGAKLEPAGAVTRGAPLVIQPRGFDPDGDRLRYAFAWKVNGRDVGRDDNALSPKYFRAGDRIMFTITASDDESQSTPLVSEEIVVQNAPPRVTSLPTGIGADGVFRYQVTAEDPDGDRDLKIRLVRGPEQMSLDDKTAQLSWIPQASQSGKIEVEVEVEDSEGAIGTQIFDFELGFAPAAPAPPS